MAIYREDILDIELESGSIHRSFLNHAIGAGDEKANRFGVRVFRNGQPEDLGANCSGYFIRATGDTIVISEGTVSGNVAYVTLPEACYAVEGNFSLAIKVTTANETSTMRIIDGVVSRTTTDALVDPGTLIPSIEDLIEAIEEARDSLPPDYTNMWTTFAPAYSTSETYAIGQYVTYDGKLYRCRTTIGSAESWTAGHWAQVTVGGDLNYLINDFAPAYSTAKTYEVGDYVSYLGRVFRCKTAIETAEAWTSGHWQQVSIGAELKPLNASAEVTAELKELTDESMIVSKGAATHTAVDISGDFEQGGISQSGALNNYTNRCRSDRFYPIDTVKTITAEVESGYSIGARFYALDKSYVSGVSLGDSGTVGVPDDAVFCKFVISKSDDADITPSTVAGLDVGILFLTAADSQENELHQTVLRSFSLEGAYKYNGYLYTAYEIVENANHRTTDYVYLKAGDKFEYSLVSAGFVFSVYDKTLTVVESVGEKTISVVMTGTYTMENDGYVRFSNRVSSYPNGYVRFDVKVPDFVKKIMESSGEPMQDYFTDEMEDTITKVLALRTEPSVVFPIITDIHYKYNNIIPEEQFIHSMDNLLHFLKKVKCDFVVNLGDSSDGRAELATQIEYCNAQSKKFAEISVPYYFVQGNHELNIYTGGGYDGSDELTPEQIYTLFFNCLPQNVVRNPDNYRDYYVDFPAFDIRMIMLCMNNTNDTNAYKVGDSTVSWYRDTALDSGKTILLFTHYSPIANHNSYPTVYGNANIGAIETITEDFVEGGGTLINLYGHSHSDFHFETPYLHVAFNCVRCAQADISISAYDWLRANTDIESPARAMGTETEDCWTVCVLRPLSRQIDFIRFGAGNDRTQLTY